MVYYGKLAFTLRLLLTTSSEKLTYIENCAIHHSHQHSLVQIHLCGHSRRGVRLALENSVQEKNQQIQQIHLRMNPRLSSPCAAGSSLPKDWQACLALPGTIEQLREFVHGCSSTHLEMPWSALQNFRRRRQSTLIQRHLKIWR